MKAARAKTDRIKRNKKQDRGGAGLNWCGGGVGANTGGITM